MEEGESNSKDASISQFSVYGSRNIIQERTERLLRVKIPGILQWNSLFLEIINEKISVEREKMFVVHLIAHPMQGSQ